MATQVLVLVVAVVAVSGDIPNEIHEIHKLYNRLQNTSPPYHYTYAYELYDWKTKGKQGQYEKRHGDLATGSFYRITPDGDHTTVEYTVDTPHGFQATVNTHVAAFPVPLDYAIKAGPLAFGYPAAPGEHPMTLVDETASPHALFAHGTHKAVVKALEVTAPFNLTWGHQVKDADGRIRSQYETYQGVEGTGRFTTIEVNGTQITIETSVNASGFYATAPVHETNPALVAPVA